MNAKYFSRKFIVTILVAIIGAIAPIVYTKLGVSEMVTMTVLAMVGGIGAAYGVINIKDKSNGA